MLCSRCLLSCVLSLGKRIKQLHIHSFFMSTYNESTTCYDTMMTELSGWMQELEESYKLRLKSAAEAALVQSVPEVGDSNGLDLARRSSTRAGGDDRVLSRQERRERRFGSGRWLRRWQKDPVASDARRCEERNSWPFDKTARFECAIYRFYEWRQCGVVRDYSRRWKRNAKPAFASFESSSSRFT